MSNVLHRDEYDWSQFLKILRDMGISVKAWAEEHGLAMSSVYNLAAGYWLGQANGKRGDAVIEAALADGLISVRVRKADSKRPSEA